MIGIKIAETTASDKRKIASMRKTRRRTIAIQTEASCSIVEQKSHLCSGLWHQVDIFITAM